MQLIERCMVEKDVDDTWELIQPSTGAVVGTVSAKELWMRILETRMLTGEPYLWFIDTANESLPEFQKALGLKNNGSNLCLTGDSMVEVKKDKDSDSKKISLESFIDQYNRGFFSTNPLIKTFDGSDVVWCEVSNAAKTAEILELYEIETPSGKTIKCTGDHKIYTKNRGYVCAKDLTEIDELLEE